MPDDERSPGFTLLELIISMTITAMVVLVVYSAFSMGVRVWERQDQGNEELRREEIMLRLLDHDFAAQVPYNTLWEANALSFAVGGPKTLFYVTRNGFGALRRQGKALFFTCLFVDRDENDANALYLYKVPEPSPDLLREIRGFLGMSTAMRAAYVPPDRIRQDAVLIADGFERLLFSFSADFFEPFAGSPEEVIRQRMITASDDSLDLEEWIEEGLPGQVQLFYQGQDEDDVRLLFLPGRGRV